MLEHLKFIIKSNLQKKWQIDLFYSRAQSNIDKGLEF